MADFRTFRGVVAELQGALGGEASDAEVLELAHLLVYRPEPVGPKTVMHGGRAPMHEMPVCDVLELYQWRVVTEERQGEDAYSSAQSVDELIEWQLLAA